jgi:DNA modification methylase
VLVRLGSGRGAVALELGRSAILIELNPEYVKLAKLRTAVTPGLAL